MMPQTKIATRILARISSLKLEDNPVAEALQQNRKRGGKRKASAAQMRARAEFARRARSGEFKGARKGKSTRRGLAQNRKATKRRSRRLEENRRHTKYEENKGRRYAENRQSKASEQENEQMAAELEENAKKRKRGKRKAKRKGGKRKARRGGRKAAARRRSPKRRRSKGRKKTRRTRVVKTHVVTLPRSQVSVQERKRPRRRKKTARKGRKKGRRKAKRMLMENPGLFSGPGPVSLYENEGSPFTMASIRAYGIAAVGVGIGLIVADVTDRLIATRTPKDGRNPWYGKDAAGAIRMRPDAWRLGGQAGGAVAGMALAWWTRGRGIIPWLVGGVAVGFGANLVQQLWTWYIAPAVLKVEAADANKPSLGNRAYSLEQNYIQDSVAKYFEARPFSPTLAPGQQEPPVIVSPMTAGGGGGIYTLAGNNGVGRPGQTPRSVVRTGRVGTCAECGCSDGCFSNCPTLCPECPEFNQNTMCRHQVQPGDDIAAFASAGGVSVAQIEALNPPGSWSPGNVVLLPYGVCSAMEKGAFTPVAPETQLPQPLPSPSPVSMENVMIEPPGGPISPPAANVVYGVGAGPDDDYIKRSIIFSGGLRQ